MINGSDRYVPQNVLSVMARIKIGQRQLLEDRLREIRIDWYAGKLPGAHFSPFQYIDTLHFGRFVIIEPNFTADYSREGSHSMHDDPYKDYQPLLMLETWFDGDLDTHLNALLDEFPAGDIAPRKPLRDFIIELFLYCEEFSDDDSKDMGYVKGFLTRQHMKYDSSNTPYVAARGLSVVQIRAEQKLFEDVAKYYDRCVDEKRWQSRDPVMIHESLRAKFVKTDPEGKERIVLGSGRNDILYRPPPRLSGAAAFLRRAGLQNYTAIVLAGIGLVGLLGLVLAFFPSVVFLIRTPSVSWAWPTWLSVAIVATSILLAYVAATIRWHERRDDEFEVKLINPDKYVKNEDHVLQNPMTSAIPIKHCPFRLSILRVVLALIHWFVKYISTDGTLSGISSIHFARWSIVGDPPLLMFTSNYNRSWESYLGEFVDDAATGLTLIWSNAQGFPRTRWLFTEGAHNEQLFKAYSRSSMAETQLWYSQYWDISVLEILRNAEIRRGLFQEQMNADEATVWVANL